MELSSKSSKCFFLGLVVLVSILVSVRSTSVRTDNRAVVIDGKRRIIISGSIHYPRSTPEMWPDLIRKAKEGGLDTIETYVFWNGHEPRPREYNFEGNYDIVRFFKEIQNAGMYAILRIGPYVCAEWDYGGLPAWLRDIPGMKFRLHNEPFELEMQNFTTLIVNKMKEANLFAKQGGPIILAQIENEYGNIMGGFKGDDLQSAAKYIQWCADMANSLKVDVPWIMCQQDQHTPLNVINTCNGFYCHDWYPKRNIPKMWTENWTGWFKAWDKPDFHRPTEDVAFAVAHFFQNRGVLQNYYMYHGGTNFGRTTGGPYITTSYDYDAPLDEYGNIRQPKWGHLKQLHAVIKSIEEHLVYGNHSESRHGKITTTKYTLDGSSACFIGNRYDNKDVNVTFEGSVYHVPAWSVSIMPDCTTVAYNSAKVKTQTSIMVKKPSIVEQEPEALQWSWMPENLKPFLSDELRSFKSNHLLEQIVTGAGQSDYLWYRTSLDHDKEEKFTLFVNTTGHELYAFVNGALVGFKHSPNWPFIFQLEVPVKLRTGKNYISLLSATVGTKNYGTYYELMPAGIVGGPVKLVRANGAAIDLSHNTWSYKTGLWGELKQIHLDRHGLKWQNGTLPIDRPFTWYKTTFQAPVGSEGVAVDLLGLNKGLAWVNGNNLGRYWPTYIANDMDGCHRCDYRGPYVTWDNKEKCLTGCGEPAQRWYHVPRSFLKPGVHNTLVLFEEAGGDPSQINFKTVAVGKVCINAEKGDTTTLSCEYGRSISSIDFASFGLTRGKCGAYKGGCESKTAYKILSKACVGKESCTVKYNDVFTGKDCSCDGGSGSSVLTIQATC